MVGTMEYADGSAWRERVEAALAPRGITLFSPYKKPFLNESDESPTIREEMRAKMDAGRFDEVAEWAKSIRKFDLNLVDRSDFIIAHIIPTTASWGTAEELSAAVASRKPIFVAVDGGKKKTPLWLMGELKHKFIYDSIDEVIEKLIQIDDGNITLDNPSWRLLKKEYR